MREPKAALPCRLKKKKKRGVLRVLRPEKPREPSLEILKIHGSQHPNPGSIALPDRQSGDENQNID